MTAKNTIQPVVDAAEAKIVETGNALRAELAAINETLPALQRKAQDVADGITAEDEVLRRVRNGEEVSGADLCAARAEDEIVRLRLDAMRKRANVLTGNLPAPSTLLADKVAPAFEAILPGMTVLTTIAPAKTWAKDVPEGTTAVVLYVEKVEQDPFHQTYSGVVKAHYLRNGFMRPISVASLESAHKAAKPGGGMEVTSNVVGDENGFVSVGGPQQGNQSDPNARVMDTLTIRVFGVVDGWPVLSKVEPNSGIVKTWTMNVFAGFIRPGLVTSARVYDMPDIGEHEAFVMKYGMSSIARAGHAEANEVIEGDVRTLTLSQKINLQGVDHVAFAMEMLDGGKDWIGSSHLGLGVLTDVEVEPRVDGDVRQGHKVVMVTLTFTSRTR